MTGGVPVQRPPRSPRRATNPLYLLFFVSGLAALIYQVMWARSFGLVFGSTTRAASAVLAAFFLGMALGNWLGGRLARTPRRSLLLYALAEIAIAAGALLVPLWTGFHHSHYPLLYQSQLGGPAGLAALQVALAFVAMGPPCLAMGATLPLMSRTLVTRSDHLGRRVARAYSLNTAGATAGVLLSGLLLPIWIGTRNSVHLAAALNVTVGIAAFALWRSWPADETAGAEPAAANSLRPEWGVLAAAAGSGFASVALEVLSIRLLLNWADGSVYSFAIIVGIFLSALAVGAWLVSILADRARSSWALVAWPAALAAVAILLFQQLFSPLVEATLPFRIRWAEFGPPTYLGWLLFVSALSLGPCVVTAGMVLPACFQIAAGRAGEVGRRVGGLTALNTLAGVAGSLAAGFLIIPGLGVEGGLVAMALVYAVIACIAFTREREGKGRWLPLAVFAPLVAILLGVGDWAAVQLRLGPGERVIRYRQGEAGAVAVTERANGVRALRLNNNYTMTSTGLGFQQASRNQARLGLDLFGEARDVAFIGFGGGVTASAVTEYPSLRRIVAMELIPGVIEVAGEFEAANRGILRDPRLTLVAADGRNHLYGRPERFDVIIGDLFATYHAGTGYLYTREHFRTVAERLNPGGVFVQYFLVSEIAREELRIIVATFLDAFPETDLWWSRFHPSIGLVGRKPGSGFAVPRPAWTEGRGSEAVHLCDAAALRRWAASAPRNTDDHPIVEFLAATSYLGRGADHPQKLLHFLRGLCSGE